MKKIMKVFFATFFTLALLFPFSTSVSAAVSYRTYTQNGYGEYVKTQTAYVPVGQIDQFDNERFASPEDIKVSQDGRIYVADTEHKRIVVGTADGHLLKIIGAKELKIPRGIFVTPDNTLYVADEGAGKVFVYDEGGKKTAEFQRPSSILFGAKATFSPQKIAVDAMGNMYVISKGNNNGIIQLSPKGEFVGYFGANTVSYNFITMLRKKVFSQYQLSKMNAVVPSTTTNLTIDKKGLVYTVTQGDKADTLKKLNMAGNNMLHTDVFDTYPSSVALGGIENIFVASRNGYIYEYSRDGNLLFVFGGRDDGAQRIGLFKAISGIAVGSNGDLYTIDAEKNEILIFRATEFAGLVHSALSLYQDGKYVESKKLWQQVLKMNSLFDYANKGLGEAYYEEENFGAAMNSFQMAVDRNGYSDSFWEVRNVWVRENIGTVLAILLGLCLISKIARAVKKKYPKFAPVTGVMKKAEQVRTIRELKFSTYFLKNPADANYGIKHEHKTSVLSAFLMLCAFFLVYVCGKYFSGFLFRTVREGEFDFLLDALYIFSAFLLICICCYLICSIKEGEATFRELFMGFAYSLAPYILIKPFVILLSNWLTYNEAFLVHFADIVLVAWCLILAFVMIKELNGYALGQTVKIILLTLFAIAMAIILLFIFYVLFSQVIDFLREIFGEVAYRVWKS